MNIPKIKEFCPGEIHDFILECVRKESNNIPPGFICRRRELCDAILAANKEEGNRARMKTELVQVLKQWRSRKDQIAQLIRAGFDVERGKTHYKIRIQNSGYFLTLAATPGDQKTGANATNNAILIFF